MRYITFILLLLSVSFSSQNLVLVKDGIAVSRIVIPSKATTIEKKSADELQNFIQQISGAQLPIVSDKETKQINEVLVGNTSHYSDSHYAGLEDDGVLIKTLPGKLIIAGGKGKGTLNAVYEFLENNMGCRKFTNDFVKIPKKKTITLSSINYKYNPPYTFRSVYSLDAIWFQSYAEWHKLYQPFEGRGTKVHTFKELLPAEKYYKTHPEYFALVNGKRIPNQPCLSNLEVFNIMKNNLALLIKQHPEFKIWSVSHNDNADYCHCSLCESVQKKGNGFSETLIPFVNKMAAAFPAYTISTLGYNQSVLPSKYTKPEKNVEIMFCMTYSDKIKPINESSDQSIVNALFEWKKQTDNIFIWDYPVNYNHSLAPFPSINTFQPNMKFYRENGIKKVFEQLIGTQKGEMSELKSYLLAKLMWNPDIDVEAITNEFLQAYYGNAWVEMREYLNLLNTEANKSGIFMNEYSDPLTYKNTLYSEKNMAKYRALFKSAELKEPNSNILAKESLGLDYVELLISKNDLTRMNRNGGKKVFIDKASAFEQKLNKLGVVKLSSDSRTPAEFKKELLSQ